MTRLPASLVLCLAVVPTLVLDSEARGGVVTESHITATDGEQHNRFGYSISLSAGTVLVGAPHDDSSGFEDADSAYVFVRDGANWIHQAKLIGADSVMGDFFGAAAALSGDTAVVGAPLDDTAGGVDAGSVYVFVRVGTTWTQQAKLTASDAAPDDRFGSSVSIEGNTAIVGAPFDNTAVGSNAGSAYVFVRNGTTWTQQAKLTDPGAAANDRLGGAVAVSGDGALVGAAADTTDDGTGAGSVSVFLRSGTTWTPQTKLTAPDGSSFDGFGASVSLSGNTALIGVPGDTHAGGFNSGSAYVFTRNGAVWSFEAYFTDAVSGDAFGHSVSVDGDRALVGKYLHNPKPGGPKNAGGAILYMRRGGAWTLEEELIASDAGTDDRFGFSVSLSGNGAAIGAVLDDTADGEDAGSAYLLELSTSSPADLDGDGDVDGADLTIVLGSWGPCPPPCPADINGDGVVDGADITILLGEWT